MLITEKKLLNALQRMEETNGKGEIKTYVQELSLKSGYKFYNSKVKEALITLINDGYVTLINKVTEHKLKFYVLKLNHDKILTLTPNAKLKEEKIIRQKIEEHQQKPQMDLPSHTSPETLYKYLLNHCNDKGEFVSQKTPLLKKLGYDSLAEFKFHVDKLINTGKISIRRFNNGTMTYKWTILNKYDILKNPVKNIESTIIERNIPEIPIDVSNETKSEVDISNGDIDDFFELFVKSTKDMIFSNKQLKEDMEILKMKISKLEEKVKTLEESNIEIKLELDGCSAREKKWMTKAIQYKEMLYSRD